MTPAIAVLVVGCAIFALLLGVVVPRWWRARR